MGFPVDHIQQALDRFYPAGTVQAGVANPAAGVVGDFAATLNEVNELTKPFVPSGLFGRVSAWLSETDQRTNVLRKANPELYKNNYQRGMEALKTSYVLTYTADIGFDANNQPTGEHHEYIFIPADKRYQEVIYTDIAQNNETLDAILSQKETIYIATWDNYKTAVHAYRQGNLSFADLEARFAHYEVARRSFDFELSQRENTGSMTAYATAAQKNFAKINATKFFIDLAPKLHATRSDNKQNTVQQNRTAALHAWDHYLKVKEYLGNEGRFAPTTAVETLMRKAVSSVEKAFEKSATAKQEILSKNPLHTNMFDADVDTYTKPLSDLDFFDQLAPYLFNQDFKLNAEGKETLEFLTDRATPHQQALVTLLFEKKEARLLEVELMKHNLPRTFVRHAVLAGYKIANKLAVITNVISSIVTPQARTVEELAQAVNERLFRDPNWIPDKPEMQGKTTVDGASLAALGHLCPAEAAREESIRASEQLSQKVENLSTGLKKLTRAKTLDGFEQEYTRIEPSIKFDIIRGLEELSRCKHIDNIHDPNKWFNGTHLRDPYLTITRMYGDALATFNNHLLPVYTKHYKLLEEAAKSSDLVVLQQLQIKAFDLLTLLGNLNQTLRSSSFTHTGSPATELHSEVEQLLRSINEKVARQIMAPLINDLVTDYGRGFDEGIFAVLPEFITGHISPYISSGMPSTELETTSRVIRHYLTLLVGLESRLDNVQTAVDINLLPQDQAQVIQRFANTISHHRTRLIDQLSRGFGDEAVLRNDINAIKRFNLDALFRGNNDTVIQQHEQKLSLFMQRNTAMQALTATAMPIDIMTKDNTTMQKLTELTAAQYQLADEYFNAIQDKQQQINDLFDVFEDTEDDDDLSTTS